MEPKWILGIVGICGLTAIQITAFMTGHNGQILSITTGGIASIIAFLLGLNIPSPSQKQATREAVTSVIKNLSKPKE